MSDENMPVNPDEPVQLEDWPERYFPADTGKESQRGCTDDDLRQVIHGIATTNEALTDLCQRQGIPTPRYYKLKARLPELDQAHRQAMAMRLDRQEQELLEIADAPLNAFDDKAANVELAHRRLRMDARKHLTTRSKQALAERKRMETISVQVPKARDGQQTAVNIAFISYDSPADSPRQSPPKGQTINHSDD